MTQDHDFKALVRARMAKTGESYASARRQLRATPTMSGRDPQGASAHAGRGLLTLVAQGHVEVRGPIETGQRPRYDIRTPIGVELAGTRFRLRAATRPHPRSDRSLALVGITLDGSQGIESIEFDGDDVTIRGEGHLAVQLSARFDLVIEADGHVFVSDADGDVEVVTPDGHVRLGGRFGHVNIETGDGHVIVDSLESGTIRTGDGNVTAAVASDDLGVEIEAEKVSIDGPIDLTGGGGHWSAVIGGGARDRLVIETTGRVGLAAVLETGRT